MVVYLDIETRTTRGVFPNATEALEEISLIQIVFGDTAIVYGLKDFKPQEGYDLGVKLTHVKCLDEKDMLLKFLSCLSSIHPKYVCAWNGIRFDFLYIYNRLLKNNIDVNKLSYDEEVTLVNDRVISTNIRYIDLMVLYKTMSGVTLDSYSLDSVSKHEVHEEKEKHDEFLSFDDFFTGNNYQIKDEPYDDRVREEIRKLEIMKRDGVLNEGGSNLLKDLIYFRYVFYGVKDSLLMQKIDNKCGLTKVL